MDTFIVSGFTLKSRILFLVFLTTTETGKLEFGQEGEDGTVTTIALTLTFCPKENPTNKTVKNSVNIFFIKTYF